MATGSQVALLATVALLACERPPPRERVAQADTAVAATPDTIVRRIVRVYRTPSAVQRATGAVHALRALQPLDSILAVRVFDQRGLEMPGVRVSWSIASPGDGAELKVINARTDSLGLSRVAFTPGRSASPQSIVADIANVGRIAFEVTVPVTSIRLSRERLAIWSGDEDSVTAELRDLAGVELAGGSLVWGTTDSTVLNVLADQPSSARVRGKAAGAADVVAWIEPGTVRGYARVTVRPVISGAFVTLDGTAVPDIRMDVRTGAQRDSLPVVTGRFSKRVDLTGGAHTDVEIRAVPSDDDGHHPVQLRITTPRALQNMIITLIPTRWRIEGGTFHGREVQIDAMRALRRPPGSAAFWRIAPVKGRAPVQIHGWPESTFPLRLAFNRGRSNERIMPEDSAAFWTIAEQMQRDLGARFFVPAEMSGDTTPAGVVPIEVGNDAAEGHTFVTWNDAGDAYDAALTFRRGATLRSAHVVTHELLHLLGFGHATSWPSVSATSGKAETRLTPEDVAYAQLAMRLRRLQRQTGARPGLPVAQQ